METIVKEVTRLFIFGKNDPIEVTSLARFNKETGEEVPDKELDEITVEKGEAIYRKRHKLIDPKVITEFRQNFDITFEELAEIVKIDAFTLELIENAGLLLTDEQNLRLKLLVENPDAYKEYFSICHGRLGKYKETFVKDVTYTFCYDIDEQIEVTSPLCFDKETGEEVPDKVLYEAMIGKADAIYRERHKLVSPQEIIDFRKQTGLSQKQLSEITSISEDWLPFLERGEFPNQEENVILKAVIQHPELIEVYFKETNTSLDEEETTDY